MAVRSFANAHARPVSSAIRPRRNFGIAQTALAQVIRDHLGTETANSGGPV